MHKNTNCRWYGGGAVAKPAFEAMMPMRRINLAAIDAAVRG